MPACVISFSGRRDGNCSAVAQAVRDALSGRDSVQYFDCSALALTPCGGCGCECFQARERCPYFDDPVFGMYDAVTRSSMSYFVVPNYCDYPCANFFLFNERSQCYFQGRPELLEQYERAPKKFIVVSNTGRDNFITAFQYHTGDAPPDVLFLSARRFGKVSIRGDLMGSPDARAEVLRFINP
ncbi:MAG: hypothetical protein K1W21_08540 [Oscillospiraceae bacterium]